MPNAATGNTAYTTTHQVSSMQGNAALQDPLIMQDNDVFEGRDCIPGTYNIRVDESVTPVVNPPRRAPMALREDLKEELDRMTEQYVIAPVTKPTAWVSSMVVARKRNNKLRICLDPRELNKAVKRSHYPMRTTEEETTNLSRDKAFTVLDARSGFWQVKLDGASSELTTFNTIW